MINGTLKYHDYQTISSLALQFEEFLLKISSLLTKMVLKFEGIRNTMNENTTNSLQLKEKKRESTFFGISKISKNLESSIIFTPSVQISFFM